MKALPYTRVSERRIRLTNFSKAFCARDKRANANIIHMHLIHANHHRRLCLAQLLLESTCNRAYILQFFALFGTLVLYSVYCMLCDVTQVRNGLLVEHGLH
jgi:hypothetical protein